MFFVRENRLFPESPVVEKSHKHAAGHRIPEFTEPFFYFSGYERGVDLAKDKGGDQKKKEYSHFLVYG